MPFSPKDKVSMIGTFAFVLVFTMFKELWEDLQRHKSDRELNNKVSLVFDQQTFTFKEKKWAEIKSGELIKILKEEEFPCDIVLLKSDKESGIVFVDTMNLDGETNLKEKMSPKDINLLDQPLIEQMTGVMTCDSPNEHIEKWDGNITYYTPGKEKVTINVSPK